MKRKSILVLLLATIVLAQEPVPTPPPAPVAQTTPTRKIDQKHREQYWKAVHDVDKAVLRLQEVAAALRIACAPGQLTMAMDREPVCIPAPPAPAVSQPAPAPTPPNPKEGKK